VNPIEKDNKLKILEEGLARFSIFKEDVDAIPSKSMNVFYNKKMEINRDITSLTIQAYQELYDKRDIIIVDSMAGSGVSSIRLLKECKNIKKIYINDISPVAKDLININLRLNNLVEENAKIKVLDKNASHLLSTLAFKSKYKKPDVISIDPWGTPNKYIDPAFKAIKQKEGMICITATDTAVLFGVKSDACLRKYMAKPLHNKFCKEIGARILIYFISRIANINNMGIIPLLTFYSNHFIRVFVKTFKKKSLITKYIKNYGFIFHCKKCGHRFTIQERNLESPDTCKICGELNKFNYAGPLWLDEIHDSEFIEILHILNEKSDFKNKKRLEKILKYCQDEINMPAYYFNLHNLCKQLKCKRIPKIEQLIEIIKQAGYEASRTHFDFTSIKTNMDILSLKRILTS